MELRRPVITGPVPVLPAWLTDPLWDQFAALLPERHAAVVNAFSDLADTIITVRSFIRRVWETRRWDGRSNCRR
jgi:hypothetical protein